MRPVMYYIPFTLAAADAVAAVVEILVLNSLCTPPAALVLHINDLL